MALFRCPALIDPRTVPTERVRLIRDHPLALGLAAFYAPGSRNGMLDIAGQCPPLTPISAAQNVAVMTPGGPGIFAVNSTGAGLVSGTLPTLDFSTGGTMWLSMFRNGVPGVNAPPWMIGLGSYPDVSTGRNWILYPSLSSSYIRSFQNSTYQNGTTGQVLPTNALVQVATTFTPSVLPPLYMNGALISYATQSPQSTLGSLASAQFQLGLGGNQTTLAGGWWTRVLSGAEIAWLAAEPFVMLRPIQPRRTWSIPSGPIYTRPRVMLIA